MNRRKVISLPFAHQVVKPTWRNLTSGVGVTELEAAEFRVRKAVAGNYEAIDRLFSVLAKQVLAKQTIFGPFILAGASGSGKTTLAKALVTNLDPRFFVEFDLATCKASHTGTVFFGAPPSYAGPRIPAFAESLIALNDALAAYEGTPERTPEGTPLPVLCFEHADEAHPEILAALTTLLTAGKLQTLGGLQIQLGRCVILLTINSLEDAGTPLRCCAPAALGAELSRRIGDLKHHTGAPLFKPEVLDKSTVLPMFEASPMEILAHLSAKHGRDLGMACGLTDQQAGRLHLAAQESGWFWNSSDIPDTASARHIIEAIEQKYSSIRPLLHQRAWRVKDAFAQKPPTGQLYCLSNPRPNPENRTDIVLEAAGPDIQEAVEVNAPIPYLERTMGPSCVQRSDYWQLPEAFEAALATRIAGQPRLIEAVGAKIKHRLSETGSKPVLSLIVVGPTGTGKTELGKAIVAVTGAHEVFCKCNTWPTEDEVLKGIFGEDKASVASQLRDFPASVIIFDEVDKAHKKFWEFYMTVGDTGILTDKQTGRCISLRNAIILLTSNYMADQLGGLAAQAEEKSVDEMDPLIRKALTACAGINSACLERLDLAGLMMPLEGEAAYPMWRKFVELKLEAMNRPQLKVASEVAAYLEGRHLDKGGAPGARARQRTCDDLLGRWAAGSAEDFTLAGDTLTLSEAAARFHQANPTPRSERQRLWGVTDEKVRLLKAEYRGNDALVDTVVADLRIEGAKIRPHGPVAVILAVGPTGSGKSYLGKAISKAFGKGDAVEIKCAQCSEEHSISPFLFSAPAGYEGAKNGGQLTTPVLTRKDRIIIFDEIEKAHPSFLNKILNVLDEGSATDMGTQLPVDLKQCLFILTSNLTADELQARMQLLKKASIEEQEAAARAIIAATGRIAPEQLARIQHVFAVTHQPRPDGGVDLSGAIHSVLEEFGKPDLKVGAEVLAFLGQECSELPQADVRSLRRVIQRKLAPVLIGDPGSEYAIVDKVILPAARRELPQA